MNFACKSEKKLQLQLTLSSHYCVVRPTLQKLQLFNLQRKTKKNPQMNNELKCWIISFHLMDFFSHKSAKEQFMLCFLQYCVLWLFLETLLEVESNNKPLERGTVSIPQCYPFTNSITHHVSLERMDPKLIKWFGTLNALIGLLPLMQSNKILSFASDLQPNCLKNTSSSCILSNQWRLACVLAAESDP